MEPKAVIDAIATLFSEAYEGPADPKSSWFIENEPDAGIFGLISKVSALEASWSSHAGDPGTTIAGHVEYLRWSLANANGAMQGKEYAQSWDESWKMIGADEQKWRKLQSDLHAEVDLLLENLHKQEDLSGEYLTGVMALAPHAAYHLGTIRQLIERVKAAGQTVS